MKNKLKENLKSVKLDLEKLTIAEKYLDRVVNLSYEKRADCLLALENAKKFLENEIKSINNSIKLISLSKDYFGISGSGNTFWVRVKQSDIDELLEYYNTGFYGEFDANFIMIQRLLQVLVSIKAVEKFVGKDYYIKTEQFQKVIFNHFGEDAVMFRISLDDLRKYLDYIDE